MKASEILRKLADVIDSAEGDQADQPETHPNVRGATAPVDATGGDEKLTITMLSPLQQDLELQKKAVGVNNAFDDQEFDQEASDEIALIKKSAGISSGHKE